MHTITNISYTVINADLEGGYISANVTYPDGSIGEVTYDIRQLVTMEDATDSMIKSALDQLIKCHVMYMFPPPPPKPINALNLVGKTFILDIHNGN